jgi:hypothetical protein
LNNGGWKEGERENNRMGRNYQIKVYSQQRYIKEPPLKIDFGINNEI